MRGYGSIAGKIQCPAAALFCGLILATGMRAADPPRADWLTGPAMHRQLQAVLPNARWSDAPLRRVIQGISYAGRLAILLDRRIDPDQRLDLTLQKTSYEDILRQIGEDRGFGMTVFGPVIYLGPPHASQRLRTLSALAHQEARTLPAEAQRKYLRAERMGWPDLASPREMLGDLATAGGIRISGLERIPHDLWAGADLPPLPLVDRLLLLAVQFDLTLEVPADGSGVTLAPIPDDVAVTKEYLSGRRAQQLAEKWAALAPDCEITVQGEKVLVRGLVEDHERISGTGRTTGRTAPRRAKPGRGGKSFTVNPTKGPLDRLLQELAGKLQLEFRIDRKALEEAGISLSQEVSFSVREATLDELLDAVLGPAGCAFRRQGSVVEVFPAR